MATALLSSLTSLGRRQALRVHSYRTARCALPPVMSSAPFWTAVGFNPMYRSSVLAVGFSQLEICDSRAPVPSHNQPDVVHCIVLVSLHLFGVIACANPRLRTGACFGFNPRSGT
jgi:hypothetical protein